MNDAEVRVTADGFAASLDWRRRRSLDFSTAAGLLLIFVGYPCYTAAVYATAVTATLLQQSALLY